jgi:septum formation protein
VSAAVLVLASASPRRRELLERVGLRFEVDAADVDEAQAPGESPDAYAARVAEDKARLVAGRRPDAFVLAADTIVELGGEVLGKAADAAEARAMLARLAGRTHRVRTAVVLLAPGGGGGAARRVAVDTAVDMRALGDDELAGYVASGEWRGKAGAYAVQGIGAALVRAVRGSYTNVVGLPLVEVLELVAAAGAGRADLARGRAQ